MSGGLGPRDRLQPRIGVALVLTFAYHPFTRSQTPTTSSPPSTT